MELEVWVVYLCLFLVVVVYFLMKHNPDEELRKEKQPEDSPTSSYFASVGRRLECSEEELEQSMERLIGLFSHARKTEAHHERGGPPQHREPSHRELSHSHVQEKTAHPGTHERLVDEIEQAVQETVDMNVHARRRPAPRSHREAERPEVSKQF